MTYIYMFSPEIFVTRLTALPYKTTPIGYRDEVFDTA
jgi:hypothetical protein